LVISESLGKQTCRTAARNEVINKTIVVFFVVSFESPSRCLVAGNGCLWWQEVRKCQTYFRDEHIGLRRQRLWGNALVRVA
jgi:hypothetical protein